MLRTTAAGNAPAVGVKSRARACTTPRAVCADQPTPTTITRLRLQNQVSGEFPAAANRLNPDRLHQLDRQILKEAFRQARTLQQRLRLDYLG